MSANIKPLIFFLTVCTTQYIYSSGDHFVCTLICMLLSPHCNNKAEICQHPKNAQEGIRRHGASFVKSSSKTKSLA